MPDQAQELIVRQHQRLACKVSAVLWIADASAGAVALSRSGSAIVDGGLAGAPSGAAACIRATVVDCSAGGLGLETAVFLPKLAVVRVHAMPEGSAGGILCEARVQRVRMLSREPRYYIGASFIGGAGQGTGASALVDWVRQNVPQVEEVRVGG